MKIDPTIATTARTITNTTIAITKPTNFQVNLVAFSVAWSACPNIIFNAKKIKLITAIARIITTAHIKYGSKDSKSGFSINGCVEINCEAKACIIFVFINFCFSKV